MKRGEPAPADVPQRRWLRWRSAAGRVGLLLLGTLLAVVVLELTLAALALFHGPRSAALPPGSGAVVLTAGDSHTFGVYQPPERSYPGRLQARLDDRAPGAYRVVNRGLPGMNSSQVAARMPGWLERYRPRFVVVCVGINNLWNTADAELDRRRPVWARWLLATRTARLARWLAPRSEPAELPSDTGRAAIRRTPIDGGRAGVEHRDAETGELLIRHRGILEGRARGLEAAAALLVEDLVSLRDLTHERGAELILLTYAVPPESTEGHLRALDGMSDTLLAFARLHRLRSVDPRPRFAELPRDVSWYSDQTGHPSAAGYDEIARLVADEIAPQTIAP